MSDDDYGETTSDNGSGIRPHWLAALCGLVFVILFFVSGSLLWLIAALISLAVAAFAAWVG
jgi:hypothetical protein